MHLLSAPSAPSCFRQPCVEFYQRFWNLFKRVSLNIVELLFPQSANVATVVFAPNGTPDFPDEWQCLDKLADDLAYCLNQCFFISREPEQLSAKISGCRPS
ncbi:hypothetical protein [Massilia phosphatilytica]